MPFIAQTMLSLFALAVLPAAAQDPVLTFGVVTQRSALLTAQYWNPILHYVSRQSGIPLQLKLYKSGGEHTAAIGRGEFDFLYSNHNFHPENDMVGYTVFARPIEPPSFAQIIVQQTSSIHTLADLEGKVVAFPSATAFLGYSVPCVALQKAKIHVKPLFAGSQESAMWQLISGRAVAASVNSTVAENFSRRVNIHYRVLWNSEEFMSIPISAHPSVPAPKVLAVRNAFLKMNSDPEAIKILQNSAELIRQKPPLGFIATEDSEYNKTRQVYKQNIHFARQP